MNKTWGNVLMATAAIAAVAVYAGIQALAIDPDLVKTAVGWVA